MNAIEARPLPNAADKAALKAIATTIVKTCPGLRDTAYEVAGGLLKKYGLAHLDPDKVYFHRFDAAQSSTRTFTGWEHLYEKPATTLTLTQLVIQRFRVSDQDNADLLDVYAGFYTAGPEVDTFNETNEVHLHGNEVLNDFWNIDFSALYTDRLTAFWNDNASDFRTLTKCTFLSDAVQARDKGQLSDDDFQHVTNAVIGPITWPVSLQLLQAQHTCDGVRTLDFAGYVATNILRFVLPKGRQILYLPGEHKPFAVVETITDMHFWMLQQLNTDAARKVFMSHYSLRNRQVIGENISDIMNQLVAMWGTYDHHLINQENHVIEGDAFSWLRDAAKDTMFADSALSLTSNGDLRKKLWKGYLSAGLRLFGPMAVVGWPVALPVVGASLASLGLNIDQAANGKTPEDRKAGILGSVLSSIDLLFNLLMLKGPGSLQDIGPEIDAAEAQEMADLVESTQPAKTATDITIEQPTVIAPDAEVPASFKIEGPLSENALVREPGKFHGTYRLASNPSTAIKLNDNAYYVRYENGLNGRGHWAIIDPANPDAFSGSIPVRMGAEGKWEVIPRLGLKGGMDVLPSTVESTAGGRVVEEWAQSPGVYVPGLEDPEMRAWALGGPDVQGQFRRVWTLGGIDVRSVVESDLESDGARSALMAPADEQIITLSEFDLAQEEPRTNLINDARAFYELHPPTPRPPVSATAPTPTELLETALAQKPRLVIGESRGSIGSKTLLIEEMPNLARTGVKTLYLQELLANVNQLDLDAYARSGEMSEELENYLTRLDIKAGNDPEGKFNLLSLVKAANAQRIRVQAIDMSTTYNINKDPLHPVPDTQMSRSFFASEVIRFNQELKGPAKWVALVDQENMAAFRGYQGISEQTDALCIRVVDAQPGSAHSITADPGVTMEYADYPDAPAFEVEGLSDPDSLQSLIKGDWRVQMQTPWAYRTSQELRALLPEPGMFTFQRYRSSILVVYRNASLRMADSVVRPTPGGRINLDTPLGRAYDTMTVANLDELKQQLIARGMRPMGWPELAGEAEGASSLLGDLAPARPGIQRPTVPSNWQANELLEGQTPISDSGKFQGIYQLDSNPATAIMMDDTAYYVRYEADANGGGHWAIIDPENPHALADSIPVRLNAEAEWETLPRLGLKGGGKTPAPHLPASEYDVPTRLRPELEDGAAGLNDEALRDYYDSLNEFDAYRDFKAIRKRLYRDAIRFYAELKLPGRPPIPTLNPDASAEEIIDKILEHARGLIIGESHGSIGSKQWLIENMALLTGKNVKTLYMEHLLTDFHQAALDAFFETGVMATDLANYLKALDVGNMTDPLERYTFLELVKQARQYRIRVQAIDCMASYRLNGMEKIGSLEPAIQATARQKMMNYYARSIIRADQSLRGAHKWIALMGNSHANTYEGVAGVSELEEAIGIRIEDVAENLSTGITVDPGKILPIGGLGDETALVQGDLQLQVETPWAARSMAEIDPLLSRHGMYTLKQEPGTTYLVHRSRNRALVRTRIETDSGRYYIERPNWPSVSGKRYPSMKTLLQALDDMGMQLGGWTQPL